MSALVPTCDTAAWSSRLEAPAMTRCECAGIPFSEVERRVREDGVPLEDIARRTGCGGTCTACLPDLRAYLARRG